MQAGTNSPNPQGRRCVPAETLPLSSGWRALLDNGREDDKSECGRPMLMAYFGTVDPS